MKRLFLIMAVLAGAACSQTSNGPNTEFANVQVSFATQRPGTPLRAALALAAAAGDTLTAGSDTLVLDAVEVVLREIELRRIEVSSCQSAESDDACEKFETGPVLVSLPLGNAVQQQFAVDVPVGTYSEIQFDIHKPDDGDPDDQAFIAANPAFERISIRVRGTFNGQAFVFTSDLNVEQELSLTPPLEITETTGATNVTILVDVGSWFRNQAGGLIDPATANDGGANEGIVKENIKDSVEAFEDRDHDGSDDD